MHTLLLADDNATIQRVIELTFAKEDVRVLAVGDGEEAMARIEAERPDIVLADIAMPKRSGYDVSAFVKGNPELAHIPVLLLAGAFEPVDRARAEQVKCDGVLVKPFEPQQVIARVRELVGGAPGTPERATADVPRPVERLTSLKLVEGIRRDKPEAPRPPTAAAREPLSPAHREPLSATQRDGALDDYFDRLDAAFADLDTREQGNANPKGQGADPKDQSPSPKSEGSGTPSAVEDDDLQLPTLEQLLGKEQPTATPASSRNQPATPRIPIDLAQYSLPPITARKPPLIDPAVEPPDASATRAPDTTPNVASPAPRPADAPQPVADAFNAILAAEQGKPYDPSAISFAAPAPPAITEETIDEIVRRVVERLSPDAMKAAVADIVADVAERLVREEIARIRNTPTERRDGAPVDLRRHD